jgi:uncharacterized protein (TIGR03437 family)
MKIPWELAGATSAIIQITALGQTSVQRTIFLDYAAPGIFSFNQQGNGPDCITPANGEVIPNTRPVQRDETIIFFASVIAGRKGIFM